MMQSRLNRFRKEGVRKMENTGYKEIQDSTSPSLPERNAEAACLRAAAIALCRPDLFFRPLPDARDGESLDQVADYSRTGVAAFPLPGVIHGMSCMRIGFFCLEGTGDNGHDILIGHRPPGPSKREAE